MQSLKRRLESTRRRSRPWPDAPVPIALTITDLDVGGAERALTSLALGLDRRRWSPRVVNLSAEGVLAATIRAHDIPVESLELDRKRPDAGVIRMAKALRHVRPALVQSFLFHANVLSRLAGPLAGSPWVLGGIRVAEHQKRWHLTLDRLTSRAGCGSVCVSTGVLRFSVEQGGLDPERLTVIPNGVDPARFDAAKASCRSELGVPEDAFLALAVGRLDAQKGLPDLLAAFERLGESSSPWRLAIVGDGPLRSWLDGQIADRPGLAGRVSTLGRRDDVPSLMRAADLLVHSAHWEGMPNVVLEAMAAGLPVVATAVEGVGELVIPGETGWIVPPRDFIALARAIGEAMQQREACLRLGRAGRHRIEEDFSTSRMVTRYEDLWAAVLGYSHTVSGV
ncbi:glycosyltransferase [Paludisphaera mucosa]|uniref:Glycosyltransferase n=1 Tax=Paludisphaera mucosa TaxID=3030827 RepID=A0ABT6F7A3_9BACT|nr:glycosyltransferase [Paludisphaera mucosa]MDG3003471.1 glycosyltransferase [Paludisphaera mucosa]